MHSTFYSDKKTGIMYLFFASVVLLLAILVVLAVHYGFIHLWPCTLLQMTGFYCLTCGATRSAEYLLHFQVFQSLFYNPLPMLAFVELLTIICFEIIGLFRKKRIPIEWIPWTVSGTVIVLFLFNVLRNFRIIPRI